MGMASLTAIVQGSNEVDLFVDRNGCAEDRGVLQTEGPLAFVHVGPVGSAGAMRDLHVDTWLHHGDRAQYVYAWSGGGYAMKSRGRDIVEGTPPGTRRSALERRTHRPEQPAALRLRMASLCTTRRGPRT